MSGHSTAPEDNYPKSFYTFVAEEHHELVAQSWRKLTVDIESVNFEIRVQRPWIKMTNGIATEEPAWLSCGAFPQLDENGCLVSIMGINNDISRSKWVSDLFANKCVNEAVIFFHRP